MNLVDLQEDMSLAEDKEEHPVTSNEKGLISPGFVP